MVDRPTGVLTHYRVRRNLGAYLDGALVAEDVRWTERHLTSCQSCQGEVAALRRVKQLVADVAKVPDPDWAGFFPGIVRGIEDARRAGVPERPRRTWGLWPRWAMGGVLAATALSLIVWQGAQGPAPAEAGVVVDSAHSEHPGATVMVYTSPDRDMAVVWVFDTE